MFERLSFAKSVRTIPNEFKTSDGGELSNINNKIETCISEFGKVPCKAIYPRSGPKESKRSKSITQKDDILPNFHDIIGLRLYRNYVLAKLRKQNHISPLVKSPKTERSKDNNKFEYRRRVHEILQGEISASKRDRLKEEIDREFTFIPKVNKRKNVKSLAFNSESNDSFNDDVFQTLYQKSKRKVNEKKIGIEKFKYKPKVNENYEYKKKADYIKQPVEERLINSKKNQLEDRKEKKKLKDQKEAAIDPKTGQKLHKPKISRGPKKKYTDSNLSLHERLYTERYIAQKKKEAENKGKKRWEETKGKAYSNQYSEKVLMDARKNKCRELFKLLDPDNCGKIGKDHIRLNYLSSKSLEVLEPILLIMEEKKISLNYDEFSKKADPLLSKLSLNQLRELAPGPRKKLDNELRKYLTFSVIHEMIVAGNLRKIKPIRITKKKS